jgi:hypothetical protein
VNDMDSSLRFASVETRPCQHDSNVETPVCCQYNVVNEAAAETGAGDARAPCGV